MTKNEMKMEIQRIYKELQDNESWKTVSDIIDLKNQYLTRKGFQHFYIRANARHNEILANLECWINASYDTLGYCY